MYKGKWCFCGFPADRRTAGDTATSGEEDEGVVTVAVVGLGEVIIELFGNREGEYGGGLVSRCC